MDLFDNLDKLPKEVQALFEDLEELDYQGCEDLLKKAEKLGYTFESGLDASPLNLRKRS